MQSSRRHAWLVALAGLLTTAFVFCGAAPGAAPSVTDPVTLYTPAGSGGFGGPTVLNAPVVGIAVSGAGYYLVAADGGVFAYRGAGFYGSVAGTPTPASALGTIGMAATPDGRGYWEVGRFGLVTPFGDAGSFGSVSPDTVLNGRIVGMAATPDGRGYWLVASDGGVFAFGDASFFGSEGAAPLNAPVVGMAATPDGRGYWLVASDGGVFAFGDAQFFGSEGATPLNAPVVGIATQDGHGYWLAAGDGGVFAFGNEPFYGSGAAPPPAHPVVAIAATPPGGYALATSVTGPTPVPSQPQVNTCGAAQTRPATIVLACADHNALFESLQWTSWSPTLARATGTYVYNTCTPDCAAGTFVTVPGTITLEEPVSTSAGVEFSRATWTYPDLSGRVATFSEQLFTDA